jgi:hypothetical protein
MQSNLIYDQIFIDNLYLIYKIKIVITIKNHIFSNLQLIIRILEILIIFFYHSWYNRNDTGEWDVNIC